jgi:hypothetical protein
MDQERIVMPIKPGPGNMFIVRYRPDIITAWTAVVGEGVCTPQVHHDENGTLVVTITNEAFVEAFGVFLTTRNVDYLRIPAENGDRITKRTEDPKLAYFQQWLWDEGIPSWRDGFSYHGPILRVPAPMFDKAYDLLTSQVDMGDGATKCFDDLEDDDPFFINSLLL